MRAFTNAVNRQFDVQFKPNHADVKLLFDKCATERNFIKTFNSDHDGSAALVRQVVAKKAPYLTLRKLNNNGKGQAKAPPAAQVLLERNHRELQRAKCNWR